MLNVTLGFACRFEYYTVCWLWVLLLYDYILAGKERINTRSQDKRPKKNKPRLYTWQEK